MWPSNARCVLVMVGTCKRHRIDEYEASYDGTISSQSVLRPWQGTLRTRVMTGGVHDLATTGILASVSLCVFKSEVK